MYLWIYKPGVRLFKSRTLIVISNRKTKDKPWLTHSRPISNSNSNRWRQPVTPYSLLFLRSTAGRTKNCFHSISRAHAHTPAVNSATASDQMALDINTAGPSKKRSTALYTWSIKTGAAAICANTDLIRDRPTTEQRIHKRCSVLLRPDKSLNPIDQALGKFRSRNRSTENTIHIAISYQCISATRSSACHKQPH